MTSSEYYPYRADVSEWPVKWQEPGRNPDLPDGLNIAPPGPWVEFAACNPMMGDEFFPDEGQHGHRAKIICKFYCPVRNLCLEHAIDNNEPYGIWGGMSRNEREREVKRRKETEQQEKAA